MNFAAKSAKKSSQDTVTVENGTSLHLTCPRSSVSGIKWSYSQNATDVSSDQCDSVDISSTSQFKGRLSTNGTSLEIQRVSDGDSGTYECGPAVAGVDVGGGWSHLFNVNVKGLQY